MRHSPFGPIIILDSSRRVSRSAPAPGATDFRNRPARNPYTLSTRTSHTRTTILRNNRRREGVPIAPELSAASSSKGVRGPSNGVGAISSTLRRPCPRTALTPDQQSQDGPRGLYFPVFTSIPPSLPSTATRFRTMPLYRSLSRSALSVILASSSGSLSGMVRPRFVPFLKE
jgi:hypothetical protein